MGIQGQNRPRGWDNGDGTGMVLVGIVILAGMMHLLLTGMDVPVLVVMTMMMLMLVMMMLVIVMMTTMIRIVKMMVMMMMT